MDAIVLAIFLINNIFWMVLLYLLIPARRVDPTIPSTENKKPIELHFPFASKEDNIDMNLPPQYDEVDSINLEDVTKSFENLAKAEKKKK
jgi:hypothetical protein